MITYLYLYGLMNIYFILRVIINHLKNLFLLRWPRFGHWVLLFIGSFVLLMWLHITFFNTSLLSGTTGCSSWPCTLPALALESATPNNHFLVAWKGREFIRLFLTLLSVLGFSLYLSLFPIVILEDCNVNFMCQLDLAKGWPGKWKSILSEHVCEGVSGRG